MARRGENIYKRKDGRYEGRYIKGYNSNGKAIYRYVYAYAYTEVRQKLALCKATVDPNKNYSQLALSQWLYCWLNIRQEIKQTTMQVYRGHIYNHIIPAIGHIPLNKLNSETIQRFVSSLQLSPSTVRVIYTVIKKALCCAAERGYMPYICSNIKLPRKNKNEIRILSQAEQKKLEEVLISPNDIGVLLSLYTGMRIGELCALRWSDIDFEKSTIHVKGTQARINGIKHIISPKSRSSLRVIPLIDSILNRLKKMSHDSEFVLSKNGKCIDVRSYRRHFKSLLKKAGLPDIRFHALRHTFSSRALEVGMDYKTLSEILGHSSVSFTLDLYTHSLDEYKSKQMNKLNYLFNSASE